MMFVLFYLACFGSLVFLAFALSQTISMFLAKKGENKMFLFAKVYMIMIMIVLLFLAMAEFHKLTGK